MKTETTISKSVFDPEVPPVKGSSSTVLFTKRWPR